MYILHTCTHTHTYTHVCVFIWKDEPAARTAVAEPHQGESRSYANIQLSVSGPGERKTLLKLTSGNLCHDSLAQ